MSWEPVDWRNGRNEARDLFAVFATDDYSPQPAAIFGTREEAEEFVKRRLVERELGPDSDQFGVSLCREGEDGRLWVWNSYDDVPEGLAAGEAAK